MAEGGGEDEEEEVPRNPVAALAFQQSLGLVSKEGSISVATAAVPRTSNAALFARASPVPGTSVCDDSCCRFLF